MEAEKITLWYWLAASFKGDTMANSILRMAPCTA